MCHQLVDLPGKSDDDTQEHECRAQLSLLGGCGRFLSFHIVQSFSFHFKNDCLFTPSLVTVLHIMFFQMSSNLPTYRSYRVIDCIPERNRCPGLQNLPLQIETSETHSCPVFSLNHAPNLRSQKTDENYIAGPNSKLSIPCNALRTLL